MSARAALIAVVLAAVTGGCSWSTDQGKTVSPDGASYSYKVPTGFFVEDESDLTDLRGEHKSGVNFPVGAAVGRVSEQTLTPAPSDITKVQASFIGQAGHWQNPA